MVKGRMGKLWSHGKKGVRRSGMRPVYPLLHSLTPSFLQQRPVEQQLYNAEEKKEKKCRTLTADYVFLPLGFETMGSFGPTAQGFVKKLGKLIEKRTGEPRESEFLAQRIGIAIQRGNGVCAVASFNDSEETEEPSLDFKHT